MISYINKGVNGFHLSATAYNGWKPNQLLDRSRVANGTRSAQISHARWALRSLRDSSPWPVVVLTTSSDACG